MKRIIAMAATGVLSGLLLSSGNIFASPVFVLTDLGDDQLQDEWIIEGEVEELGDGFPPDESIASQVLGEDNFIPCPTDYNEQGPPNIRVEISNFTTRTFTDVYYVADTGTSLTNVDEFVADANTPTVFEPAFEIDSIGLNQPLVAEVGGTIANVFEPNEVWEFVIQNYSGQGGRGPVPFDTTGIAGSSGGGLSTGSIIAVPEPASFSFLIGVTAFLAVRTRRRKSHGVKGKS